MKKSTFYHWLCQSLSGMDVLIYIFLFGLMDAQSFALTLPESLTVMLENQGYDVEGLHKEQYKIGLE